MDYDGVGTSNGHWKVTIGNTSGITEGTVSSTGGSGQRYATISDHSAMDNSADTKTITYTITGKDTRGTAFTFVQQQNIVKSKTGTDGTPGQSVRHETIFKKNDSTLTSSTAGTFSNPLAGNTDWSLSMPELDSDGDIAYAASRTFTSDGASPQDSSWTTPVAALTRTNGTNATALTITSTQQNTPSSGRTTVNFSDGSSIIIDDGDNGDDGDGVDVIYRNSSSVITDAPSASAGAPTVWSFTSSAPSAGEITYVSFGVRTNNSGNYTWSTPSVVTAQDGQDGTSSNTVFYKKNSNIYVPPSKPSGNITSTSTADNVWTNSALAAEANHVVYRSTGSNSTGSWVWSAPVIDVDLDGFTDVFEFNYNWDFSGTGLDFIGLTDDTYNNTQTGNSRTLTILSSSAAYNSARALPNGTDTTGQAYGIVTTGLPTYGGLTYPTGHKVAPSAFFIEAVQSGGYSLITFQNFQIGMTGDITYALNSKTNLYQGGLYIYLSAGISSSATTYSQVTNGDLGEVLVYNSLSFNSFTTDFGIEVQSAQLIIPDASKSVGSGYLWIWPEAYLSNVTGVANSPKINIIDRTDSKIILERTVGASQTGTFSNSTNTASIARS